MPKVSAASDAMTVFLMTLFMAISPVLLFKNAFRKGGSEFRLPSGGAKADQAAALCPTL
jgi:hypothetical protein